MQRLLGVLVLVGGASSLAIHPHAAAQSPAALERPSASEPWHRLGRSLGLGWGNGYHACASDTRGVTADLPPRSYAARQNVNPYPYPYQAPQGSSPRYSPGQYASDQYLAPAVQNRSRSPQAWDRTAPGPNGNRSAPADDLKKPDPLERSAPAPAKGEVKRKPPVHDAIEGRERSIHNQLEALLEAEPESPSDAMGEPLPTPPAKKDAPRAAEQGPGSKARLGAPQVPLGKPLGASDAASDALLDSAESDGEDLDALLPATQESEESSEAADDLLEEIEGVSDEEGNSADDDLLLGVRRPLPRRFIREPTTATANAAPQIVPPTKL
ncbi:hypothetical protein FF011L_41770 [Roseimaritima multifibrata]|uniref:Uncharacterized protein n=1 Tax=Roseimaritima multifibrata TaxID=1930274 RepID=A0A517MKG6_9BACT|nr:hypothetical protein [Roseimaritima multifibrata]QDS95381.1 hypothetical protein FF011L_41770 [Roseimaritima multifibrata]